MKRSCGVVVVAPIQQQQTEAQMYFDGKMDFLFRFKIQISKVQNWLENHPKRKRLWRLLPSKNKLVHFMSIMTSSFVSFASNALAYFRPITDESFQRQKTFTF